MPGVECPDSAPYMTLHQLTTYMQVIGRGYIFVLHNIMIGHLNLVEYFHECFFKAFRLPFRRLKRPQIQVDFFRFFSVVTDSGTWVWPSNQEVGLQVNDIKS
eukprot:GHVR01090365.1.p2 GENE.GHVR01090365.1~~GHVR01090365.1.p2  ORF type:complete len:102 (+),score=4.34 GHVR01090365.1:179-484(+)